GCGGSAEPAGAASGSGSGAGSGSSTGGGEMCPSAGDACTSCEAMSCPEVYCNCYHDPECVALGQCTAKCNPSDNACNQPCWTAHPSAIAKAALLANCAGTSCPAPCPGYKPIGACLICLNTNCAAEMNACVSNPDCSNLLTCLGACTTLSCQNNCYQQFPKGAAGAGPVGTCTQAHCAAACP